MVGGGTWEEKVVELDKETASWLAGGRGHQKLDHKRRFGEVEGGRNDWR